jgi:hypothetical protein
MGCGDQHDSRRLTAMTPTTVVNVLEDCLLMICCMHPVLDEGFIFY